MKRISISLEGFLVYKYCRWAANFAKEDEFLEGEAICVPGYGPAIISTLPVSHRQIYLLNRLN